MTKICNGVISFPDWKTIFLNHKCNITHCLNKGKVEMGCRCNFNGCWEKKTLYVQDDDINLVPYFGCSNGDGSVLPKWSSVALKMHPLVEKGFAYSVIL